MAVAAAQETAREEVADVRRYLFTVDEFYRMGEAGIFTEDDRVELIDGEIWQMTAIGPLHAEIVDRLTELFVRRLAGTARVRVQNPLRVSSRTEPQPDLVVARLRGGSYADRHPEPGDVLLVVEVADSSLRYDRVQKIPRYGAAGVPEVWLVDLSAHAVTVYTDPGPTGYARERVLRPGDVITAAGAPALDLPVGELFASIEKE